MSCYKWQKEHKRALSVLGQMAMEIAYGCMFYECIIAEKPYLERIGRQRAYNAVEEPVDGNEEVGSEGGGTEGKTTKVTSNTGNEIDITPSSNHSTASKNPGPKGVPNSSVDILDNNGNVSTRRWYDSSGNAYRDVDMTNHGNPKMHSEYPHVHTWDWTDGNPKRSR